MHCKAWNIKGILLELLFIITDKFVVATRKLWTKAINTWKDHSFLPHVSLKFTRLTTTWTNMNSDYNWLYSERYGGWLTEAPISVHDTVWMMGYWCICDILVKPITWEELQILYHLPFHQKLTLQIFPWAFLTSEMALLYRSLVLVYCQYRYCV